MLCEANDAFHVVSGEGWVRDEHVMRRHAALRRDSVEVFLFIVHVRESERREMLHHGAFAVVWIIYTQVSLGLLLQMSREEEEEGFDVSICGEGRLTVVVRVGTEWAFAAQARLRVMRCDAYVLCREQFLIPFIFRHFLLLLLLLLLFRFLHHHFLSFLLVRLE